MAATEKHLVIVESPAKARTLERYLGDDYVVEATVGHVLDLPKKGLAVDVEKGFEPEYRVIRGKGDVIKRLAAEARRARDVLLATDPDREGEAIAYHIASRLGYERDDGDRFRRVTFHEITRDAVLQAVANPGRIDHDRVDAQQARRILDRLVGYGLSPLLWKKISPKDPTSGEPLSAGRVQSVAVRLTVLRERQRRAFRRARYWDLAATLAADGKEFGAELTSVGGRRVASGRDFDETTGRLAAGSDALVLDEQAVRELRERLLTETFRVEAVEERRSTRQPYPPFTTSTLQQEANRKLNLPAAQTMKAAQRLYEAGHVTYMRTDSVHLSEQAIGAARARVETLYGREYLSPKPRRFATRSRAAQEAHEAIRPAGTEMRTAKELRLRGVDASLYDLIWKRTLACQMAEARQRHLTVRIVADDAEFRASGKILEFAGFFRAYVEGSDDPEAALEDRELILPDLAAGDEPELRELEAVEHETRPPARFTEATLVKALESEGIGRPSTYASILSTIVQRGYVKREGKQLVPSFIAFAVTALLENHFPDLVDTRFTSRMEDDLDAIAAGEVEWRQYLERFYLGEDGFEARLKKREDEIDPREASTLQLAGIDAAVRIGPYGPYLERTNGEVVTATIPTDLAPGDLTPEQAEELLRQKEESEKPLGRDPETGLPVFKRIGRYGPYVQLGEHGEDGGKPRRSSIPDDMTLEEVDLETALALLSLPRTLGPHPESGEPVKAGIGRYGPYVVHDGDFRSLRREDDVLEVSLERALELLAEPKGGRRRRRHRELKDLGPHPDDGDPIRILDGRYGPYVKHGKTNASLAKGESPDEVTRERALELLAERRSRAGASRGRAKKKKQAKTKRGKGKGKRRKGSSG